MYDLQHLYRILKNDTLAQVVNECTKAGYAAFAAEAERILIINVGTPEAKKMIEEAGK